MSISLSFGIGERLSPNIEMFGQLSRHPKDEANGSPLVAPQISTFGLR
jgi:hypothetical protein